MEPETTIEHAPQHIPPVEDAIIRLENVNMWYEKGKESEVHALNDISIEIGRGEYVAFFGPSGCGKTTLLYAISGIDRVQEGHVVINGRDISGLTNQELAIFRQTGIGIVFQQFNLVPSLTVLQNVALPMAFVGVNKAKADIEARKLLERLAIGKYADRFPHELSGGQQQRVGIARALANNPPIIIADEPLGNLDSANAKNVLEFLKELNEKDGRTIIMVTHEAWSLQDVRKVFHMKDGFITSVEMKEPKKPEEEKAIAENVAREVESKEAVEMTARILSNFLMRGYSLEEVQRFESFLKQRFEGKIDAWKFYILLDLSFAAGGVGLWKKKAQRVASYVEGVIDKRRDVNAILKLVEKNPELPIQEEVRRIRDWVTQEYQGRISQYQAVALDELIADRIRHFISPQQFREVLDRPIKDYGGGFTYRTVQKISERLETILDGTENYQPVQ